MELGNQKKSGGERLYPLSKPLICFSKEGDHFTTGNACEHVLISGRPGGAKTTSSLALFGQSYMEAGFGALVLCAKSSASDEAWEMAQRAGRARDVIFFGPNSKQCFNWA